MALGPQLRIGSGLTQAERHKLADEGATIGITMGDPCGIGAEVVARIVENALMYLEAPIRRVTGYDVHFPYFARERAFLPNADRIAHAAREVLAF